MYTETTEKKCEKALRAALEQARQSAEREMEKISDDKCRLVFLREYYLPIVGSIAEALGALNGTTD